MVELASASVASRFVLRGVAASGMSLMGLAIPGRPLASARSAALAALWLGPDEWLLLAADGETIAGCIPPIPHALIDVTHRQLGLRLSGADAATVLNGAVPLDLSPASFPAGMCARTICEKAEIVLWRQATDEWHIEVARSFAPYVRELLARIAQANGVSFAEAPSPSRMEVPSAPIA